MHEIFFFFQAEDGIRDLTVTGVQTCALPISVVNDLPMKSLTSSVGSVTSFPSPAIQSVRLTADCSREWVPIRSESLMYPSYRFRFVCICVWTACTTSPSPSTWWLTLIPVISSKALARTLDSYSCVGIVSDRTLISMPRYGLAALMNHSISLSCCSFDRVEGWNSLSIHLFAAAMSARPAVANARARRTPILSVSRYRIMLAPCADWATAECGSGLAHTTKAQTFVRGAA